MFMFFTFSLLPAYFLASDRNRSPPRPPRLSPVVFRRDVPLRSFRLMLRRAMLPTKRRRHTPIIYITAVLLSFLATLVRLVQPRSCRPGRRIHLPLRSVAALRTGVRRYIIVGSSLFSRRPTPLRPLPLCGSVEEKSVRRRVAIASARSGKKGDVSRCTSVVSSLSSLHQASEPLSPFSGWFRFPSHAFVAPRPFAGRIENVRCPKTSRSPTLNRLL